MYKHRHGEPQRNETYDEDFAGRSDSLERDGTGSGSTPVHGQLLRRHLFVSASDDDEDSRGGVDESDFRYDDRPGVVHQHEDRGASVVLLHPVRTHVCVPRV